MKAKFYTQYVCGRKLWIKDENRLSSYLNQLDFRLRLVILARPF